MASPLSTAPLTLKHLLVAQLMSPGLVRAFMRGLAVFLVFGLRIASAYAYPQWQLSTGESRCNQCHFAPGGGGLLTNHGRDAVGDDLSTFGGDGAFLHGAVHLPNWLALGGDLRGAFVDNDVQDPKGPAVAVFPMQADFAARLALPAGLSVGGTLGFRGQIRNPNTLVPIQNYQPISSSQLISREHYLMVQADAQGPYLRVGRFYAPFGLRFAEHNVYTRRDLGFDHLQETYNVSGGLVFSGWELHVSLFAPDFVRHIGSNERGVAAYYEHRLLNDTLALGGQLRVAASPGVTRFVFGSVGKGYLEPARLLAFIEINGVVSQFDDQASTTRGQFVGVAGVTTFPLKGVSATVLGERNQVDLALPDSWTAASAWLNWFPYAHGEVQLVGRVQFPSGGSAAKTLFLQLHYFL